MCYNKVMFQMCTDGFIFLKEVHMHQSLNQATFMAGSEATEKGYEELLPFHHVDRSWRKCNFLKVLGISLTSFMIVNLLQTFLYSVKVHK